jgi:hypothetical protein
MLTAIMTEDQIKYALMSNKVLANIKYTKDIETLGLAAQAQLLTNFLHIKNIVTVQAIADSTDETGSVAAFVDVWSSSLIQLAYMSPGSKMWTKGLGRQPRWSKFSTDFKIESYDEPQTASRVIRAREHSGEYLNVTYGCLLTGVV